MASLTGHRADVAKLPEDHAVSLSDLRELVDHFDSLEIIDNSAHHARRRPRPIDQIHMEKGVVTWKAETLKRWCAAWLGR